MIDLKKFYKNVLKIKDEKLIEKLIAESEVRYMKKGETVVSFGEVPDKLFFMYKGLFRGVCVDSEGNEITDFFVSNSGTPLFSCCDVTEASPVTVEILESSIVVGFPAYLLTNPETCKPELLEMYNRLLKSALKNQWEIKMVLTNYSAMEKYQ